MVNVQLGLARYRYPKSGSRNRLDVCSSHVAVDSFGLKAFQNKTSHGMLCCTRIKECWTSRTEGWRVHEFTITHGAGKRGVVLESFALASPKRWPNVFDLGSARFRPMEGYGPPFVIRALYVFAQAVLGFTSVVGFEAGLGPDVSLPRTAMYL